MKLHTSYFAKVKHLQEMGYNNLVCIAGYAPKFFFNVSGARFVPELAPKREWWREWHGKFGSDPNSLESVEWYTQRYVETVLNKLNPHEIVGKLGDGAVMLCYERPDAFCHRHIVSKWITSNTGVEVEEISI